MARHDTGNDAAQRGSTEDDPEQQFETIYQGFPASAIADKPGQEREYTLDRIERTIGSIL